LWKDIETQFVSGAIDMNEVVPKWFAMSAMAAAAAASVAF
jgi:hypothetical protein